MTTEPVDPDQLEVSEGPHVGGSSDEDAEGQDSTSTDVMGIDDDDPIDATLVGRPVDADDDGPTPAERGSSGDDEDNDVSS